MRQQFEREMGAKGLRPPEFSTLVLIAANPLATQAEIAQALNIQRPNMVGLIGGLEARGLITRTVYEHDRRNHMLALTPRGAAFLEEARRVVLEMDRRVTACWIGPRARPGHRAARAALGRRPGRGLTCAANGYNI